MRDSDAPKGYSGLSIDLMEVLAAIGKFDYVIKETNEHGNRRPDGTWTGQYLSLNYVALNTLHLSLPLSSSLSLYLSVQVSWDNWLTTRPILVWEPCNDWKSVKW